MMFEMHIIDQLPEYVLDCLQEDEKLQVKKHLETCTVCQAELLNYQDLVNELPYGMKIVEPNPSLRNRIFTQIKVEKRSFNSSVQPSSSQQLNRGIFSSIPLWGFASLALILVLAISNLVMWQRLKDYGTTSVSPFNTVSMLGTEYKPDATGMLVISADGEYGTLVVDRLPVLDETHQYQLWLIQDGKRTSGGVFSVSLDGYGNLKVTAPLPLVSYTDFGITIEPVGGSPGPTGEKVLGGSL